MGQYLQLAQQVKRPFTEDRQPISVRAEFPLIECMPAAPNARGVYWEAGGRILGPAVPEFLARNGSTFWIVTTFEGQPRWINADRLRSRKVFEQ